MIVTRAAYTLTVWAAFVFLHTIQWCLVSFYQKRTKLNLAIIHIEETSRIHHYIGRHATYKKKQIFAFHKFHEISSFIERAPLIFSKN